MEISCILDTNVRSNVSFPWHVIGKVFLFLSCHRNHFKGVWTDIPIWPWVFWLRETTCISSKYFHIISRPIWPVSCLLILCFKPFAFFSHDVCTLAPANAKSLHLILSYIKNHPSPVLDHNLPVSHFVLRGLLLLSHATVM